MAPWLLSHHYIKELCLLIAAVISYIFGLMTNFFIIGVSAIDRLKGRPLTPADLLITAIATSRIIFQLVTLFDIYWKTFIAEYSPAVYTAIYWFGSSSVFSNIWFSVLQSVFYSLKISNFHNDFFLYLKKTISQRVLGLSVAFVLLSTFYPSAEFVAEFMMIIPKNSTQVDGNFRLVPFMFYILFLLMNILPFLFYAVSCFALLGSLFHHMYRMRRENNVSGHLDAYIKTVKFTIVSFWCFALYVICNIFGKYFLGFLGCFLVANCFLVLHSMYLIYMTARLRGRLLKILHGLTKYLAPNKGSLSKSGLEVQTVSH
ncbi:hypothetical protein GDO81_022034 [Engystomops pustulosus]|uniref:Taste receptor type 2 n=1 Tax=Engystomops pustulosus TaxID=76066 RepID=A0AAV6YV67_ENGPU|nr:hypothetical protein GDO81_022034 [Engystomops pustulosus]